MLVKECSPKQETEPIMVYRHFGLLSKFSVTKERGSQGDHKPPPPLKKKPKFNKFLTKKFNKILITQISICAS